jgi:hypothetical protein
MFVNIFKKGPVPRTLPKEMQKVVNNLAKTKSKKQCLELAYSIMINRFQGCGVFFNIGAYFTEEIQVFWDNEKETHCTNLNYILEVLLVRSKKFVKDDIKIMWTISVLSPHQYLRIKINESEWINVDVFAGTFGVKLGEYNSGFKRIQQIFYK